MLEIDQKFGIVTYEILINQKIKLHYGKVTGTTPQLAVKIVKRWINFQKITFLTEK